MDGTLIIEVYLLAHMRASDLVEAAYQRLGLDLDAIEEYRAEGIRRGLDEPGHPMDVYAELLGKPSVQEHVDDVDPYRQRRWIFSLPLWPELLFVVHGSESGQTGGVAFISPRSAATPPAVTATSPWRLVEEQVAEWPELRVADEWYPMKDYQVLVQDEDGAWVGCVLHFDYGLLQAAIRC